MWSHLSLFLIVGVAVSYCDQTETHEHAWNKGKEYKYLVRSTTMTSLDDPHHEATGITMKGILVVQAITPNKLYGKLSGLEYAHKEEIPKTQPHEGSQEQDEIYHNVPISEKPFQITVENGVIQEMMVQKEVPIWEVNILKSIISQLQVDTSGENVIPSKYNQMPEDVQHPFASYKVMEDSVGGNCEVIYDIVPLEEDLAKNKPEMIPLLSLDGGNLIEIRKTKDFKNCKEQPNYIYNQTNQRLSWPYTSKSDPDTSVSQVSMTRMVISGNLRHFTTQSSVTKSTIFIKSDKKDRVIGNVYSMINLTLVGMNNKFIDLEDTKELITSTGNLIFMDKNPFAESQIHPRPITRNLQQIQSSDKSRLKETLRSDLFDSHSNSDSSSSEEKIPVHLMQYSPPRLTETPYNPFMPVFIGLSGKNSSENFNAVVLATNLIMRITKAIEDPTVYKPDEMIETFTILQDLLRTMITDQLTEVEQRALKLSGDSMRDTVQKVIYKTIAQIGTGPSLLKLTNWIKNAAFSNVDAAILVARIPKTIRTLTAEYLKHFHELISMPETIDKDGFNISAPIAFAELIRTAQDDKRRYPLNSYGRTMITNEDLEMYISYFAKQLKEAVQKNNRQRVHTYITALSHTGHPKILSVFEPYLEGKEPVSKCQLRMMVTGLSRLARTYPALARSVLAKIYLNTRENDEIRVAAFFSLIKTDPPLLTYMRMAQFTNYDRSPLVNSAVRSTIRSLALLRHARARNIASKARLARELLNKKSIDSLNSIGYYVDTDNEDTLLRSFYVETMGSGKTDVNHVDVGLSVVNDYLKLFNFRFGYGVSDVKQILDFLYGYYNLLLPKQEKQKRTLVEELMRALNVEPKRTEPLEGYLFSDSKYETQFYPFDKSSLERDISRTVTNISKVLSEDFNVNTIYNHDEILSFPTETGLPFVHTIQTPIVQKLLPKDPKISLDKDVEMETALEMLFASRVQNRWGFTVPFEFQQYHAGIDRDFHTYLPAKLKIKEQLDGDHLQLQLRLNPALLQKNQQDHSLMYFSTVPFVIRHHVLDFEPLSRNNMLQGKMQETSKRSKFQAGIFQILIEGHEKLIQTPNLSNIIRLFSSASQGENSYKKIDVSVPTTTKGLHLSVAHAKSNTNSPATQQLDLQKCAVTDRQPNSEARRKQFLTEVSKGLQSSHNHVWDIDLGYPTNTSQKLTHQVITLGVGHNNANKKYHTIFYWNIQPAMSESVDYEICSTGITELSRETPLDLERMLDKCEQRDTFECILQYGKNYVDGEKVHIKGNTLQSNDLKNTLRNNEIIKECLRNIKDNKESQACQKATQLVQLKDRLNLSVATDSDEQTAMVEILFKLFSRIYNRIAEKIRPRANKKNIIDVEVKMSQDRDQADVFVSSFDKDISLSLSSHSNTLLALSPSTLSWQWLSEVSQLISKLLWPLPVEVGQHLATGLLSSRWLERIQSQWEPSWKLLSLEKQIDSLLKDAQQPSTCNVGKHQVTTFDGKTYPIDEKIYWQVLVIPTPRYEETLPENEKISVLIKKKDDLKDIRLLLGSKDVDIRKTNDGIQVLVDGRLIKQYNMQDKPENTSHQIRDNDEVYVEIYELPDKSVEIKSCKYGANVVYNGELVAIQVADQYTNRIVGLCGNYDSKPDNDFLSPQNCIAQNPQDFNAMYTLTEDSQHGYTALNKDKQYPCVQQKHHRSNVISDIEAGRSPLDWSPYSKKASRKEIKDRRTEISFTYRTKIQAKDDELCFSTRPIPLCEGSLPTKTKSKTFEFFCLPKNEATEQLKLRIEQGANPDFSQKPVSFKKAYEVPLTCRAA